MEYSWSKTDKATGQNSYLESDIKFQRAGMKFSHENLAPKEATIFLMNYQLYSPAFFHNFHAYTTVFFSHPLIKISCEKFGFLWFIEFLEQTLHAPLRQFKMEF